MSEDQAPWEPPQALVEDPLPDGDPSSAWGGIGLVALGHVIASLVPPVIFFLGFVQWVYVIPLALRAKKRGYRNRARGVWTTACITLGLQILGLATCNKWLRL